MKRHVRHSKSEPRCDEVTLLEANPTYAFIRHENGKEATVSLADLAPLPGQTSGKQPETDSEGGSSDTTASVEDVVPLPTSSPAFQLETPPAEDTQSENQSEDVAVLPRRSQRKTKAPDRFGDWAK